MKLARTMPQQIPERCWKTCVTPIASSGLAGILKPSSERLLVLPDCQRQCGSQANLIMTSSWREAFIQNRLNQRINRYPSYLITQEPGPALTIQQPSMSKSLTIHFGAISISKTSAPRMTWGMSCAHLHRPP